MEHFYKDIDGWFGVGTSLIGGGAYDFFFEHFKEEPKIMVELGVYKGRSSSYIGVNLFNKGWTNVEFHLIDHFLGSEEHDIPYPDYLYKETVKNMLPLKDKINYSILRKTSEEAAKAYEDESLDFVFIDASHDYENVYKDIMTWLPKIKNGGIISGDDYCTDGKTIFHWEGVVRAVNDIFGKNVINFGYQHWCVIVDTDIKLKVRYKNTTTVTPKIPPNITVGVLSYNKNSSIIEMLWALSQQTVVPEVIISDDGSKSLLDPNHFPFITKYYWNKDVGITATARRNQIINECETDYLICLDDDCVPFNNHFIETYLKYLKEYDVVRGRISFDFLGDGMDWFHTNNAGFNVKKLREIGGFDMNYNGHYGEEDEDIGMKIRESGLSVCLFPEGTEAYHKGEPYASGDRSSNIVSHNREYFKKKWGGEEDLPQRFL